LIVENPVDFPSITFCNNNWYKRSVVEKSEIWKGILLTMYPIGPPPAPGMLDLSDPAVLEQLKGVVMYKFYQKAMHQFKSMFGACYLMNGLVNCSEYFTPVKQPMGICYTFNSGEYIKQHGRVQMHRTGPPFGLRVVLTVEQDEYFASFFASAGFQVKCKE